MFCYLFLLELINICRVNVTWQNVVQFVFKNQVGIKILLLPGLVENMKVVMIQFCLFWYSMTPLMQLWLHWISM